MEHSRHVGTVQPVVPDQVNDLWHLLWPSNHMDKLVGERVVFISHCDVMLPPVEDTCDSQAACIPAGAITLQGGSKLLPAMMAFITHAVCSPLTCDH